MATLGQVSRPGRRLDSNKPAAWWRLINKECDMGAVLGDVGKFPRVGAAEGRDFAWGRGGIQLTPETIDALAGLHREQSVDDAAYTMGWQGKQAQLENLQKQFVKVANTFVYRTKAEAVRLIRRHIVENSPPGG
ncbi:unnamed protein product [Penicillium camemberti]|uniref:Str. FM013 n=1 Tax=Penicillium camemberti (strain FM 013) TaxID=1429867 RepID=A0A0G4PWA8_PENC3|nr:unnamed protein product [Penicillium camemberti]